MRNCRFQELYAADDILTSAVIEGWVDQEHRTGNSHPAEVFGRRRRIAAFHWARFGVRLLCDGLSNLALDRAHRLGRVRGVEPRRWCQCGCR